METVTEKQVMSQEEIQTLSNIQNNTQQLIYELGEIELFLSLKFFYNKHKK